MFRLIFIFMTLFLFACSPSNPTTPITAPPVQKKTESKKRLLILGDSLTEGYGVNKAQAFPAIIQQKLDEKKLPITVVNGGSSGATSASALKRLQWHLKSPLQYLVIALGSNDGLRGLKPQSTFENLDKAIQLAQKNNVVIFLSPMKVPKNYGQDYSQAFEKTFDSLFKKHSSLIRLPYILKDVATRPHLNLPDGIHPNVKGHQVITETILPQLLGKLTHARN